MQGNNKSKEEKEDKLHALKTTLKGKIKKKVVVKGAGMSKLVKKKKKKVKTNTSVELH